MKAIALSACAACAFLTAPVLGQGEGVQVQDMGTVDIAVQDTDLAQVLQMLSLQTKKNIIASRNVSGTVTANLYNVTFYEALDSILRINGFTYEEQGNFIYVYTQAEYDEIQAAARQTESRIFELDYLSAADAQQFITPLLSTNGQISAIGTVDSGFLPGIDNGGADDYAYNPKVVVNDYPEVLESIATLIKDLDTPPQQVLVEAAILQTRLTEDNAFGIDFSVLGGFDFSDLADPLSPVTEIQGGLTFANDPFGAAQSTVGNTSGTGSLKIGIISNDISFFMRLLDDVSDTVVLARPKVLTLNRQRAQVLVGRRVGYLSTTATQTTTTQTVQYLDTGVQLIFRPFISRDGTIRMELAPSVSEANLRQVSDQGGNLVTIPDEDTNEITTNVRVRDGKTIVLGGLFRESTQVTRRTVPFFGDIPLLGAVFNGQEDIVTRTEITFLITPTIVSDESLGRVGQDLSAHMDRAMVGARNGLLPFSRDQVTTNYNMDAFAAFNAGDTEMALFYINNSLRMHPNQQDILKLRQKVTGAKVQGYERSLMERALRKELGRPIFGEEHSPNLGLEPRTTPNGPAAFSPFTKTFEDIISNGMYNPAPLANAPTAQE